jgi:type IV pilus assembly protein PilQ
MTKTIFRFTAFGLGLALALSGLGQVSPATASKVTILPTRVYTRIVVEAASPIGDVKASYAAGDQATLLVDLGSIAPPIIPPIPADDPQLVRDVQIRAQAGGRVILAVGLLEAVPFRVWTEGPKAVVELNKIIRGDGYWVAPEAEAELGRTPRKPVELGAVDVADRNGRVEVSAPVGRKGIANVFALENPLRLVVDLFDARLATPTQTLPVGKYGVDRIKVGQFRTGDPHDIVRIVFDLREPRGYTLAETAAGPVISFAGTPAASSGPAPAQPITPGPPPAGAAGNPAAQKIEKKTEEPAGKPAEVAITKPTQVAKTTESAPPPAAKIEAKPAETKTAEAPAPAPRKEDSPPAPPKMKETKAEPRKIEEQKVEETKEDPDQEAQKQEDKFKPRTIHDQGEKYSGELLSPKFKNADLQDVVLWLGERVGLNVVFDPEVRGTVTCNFVDVPWDQFLDIILKNNKQGRVLEGNILRIAPLGVLADEQRSQQLLRDATEQSGPLVTKMYTLSYAKAQDILDLMKDQKSARGQMVVDQRTQTLIVRDTQEKINLIDKLVADLDTPTPQVQIETRIIEATSNFVRDLGIQWGARGVADPFYGNQTSLQFPNKVAVDGAMIPEGQVTRGIGGPLGGYAVNLPAAAFNSVLGMSFANVLDTFRLDVALSALESKGEGRIVSSQRITAQNNKEAYINQGRQIPVQTQANFTVTVQYVNAGLELKATPQITAEGTIIMYVEVQNNAADFANLVNGIPPITTQSAKTTVTVFDGGTTVIGGIYRVEDSITRERTPFLHSIPILGNLFKNSAVTKQNRELLIFITPRILR